MLIMKRKTKKVYPRTNNKEIVYLNSVINDPNIVVGDYTFYDDFVNDPRDFQKNNVLYHYPINNDRLTIGKFCSIGCGAKFLFISGNHVRKRFDNNIMAHLLDIKWWN